MCLHRSVNEASWIFFVLRETGMLKKLVVIGNGMAAGRALEELFSRWPDAYKVTIFGAEPRVNYNRIMLSPVLSGEKAYEDILIHDDAWYEANGVTLHCGKQVVQIDRDAKHVRGCRRHDGGVRSASDRDGIAAVHHSSPGRELARSRHIPRPG